jgi:UDP-N-acetylmuramoyl-tripeptide--D-alanyl-D-alanine ligase
MAMTATSSKHGTSAKFKPDQLVGALLGATVEGQLPRHEVSLSTDTRSLQQGDVYLALVGENFDGHHFVANAIKCGASACIVNAGFDIALDASLRGKAALIRVADTLDALHDAAKFFRRQVNPYVIAVTGSSGKTTTKEMCAAVVEKSRRTHKAYANENNEIGVPKTILSMPGDCQVLVLEMAMRGAGQIAQLARTAEADVGIITNCGIAHMELLGSAENIIKAKCELFEHLNAQSSVAIIGAPTEGLIKRANEVFSGKTELFAQSAIEEIEVTPDFTRFKVSGFAREFTVYAHGVNHISDAWCAINAGKYAGLTEDEIAHGLEAYRSPEGRGQRKRGHGGSVIVDESYNANPDSVRCAVEAILDTRAFPQERKFVVLGEMAELGPDDLQMHFELGQWLKQKKITALLTVGDKAARIADGASGSAFEIQKCDTQSHVLDILRKDLKPDACVMVKGSHCAGLENLVAELLER